MSDDIAAKIDISQPVLGLSGKPEKDLLDVSNMTATLEEAREIHEKAKPLSLHKLMSWVLLEGINTNKGDVIKKVMHLTDVIDTAMRDHKGIWDASDGDLSKFEELLGTVEHKAMNTGKFRIALARMIEDGKDQIAAERLKKKEKPALSQK